MAEVSLNEYFKKYFFYLNTNEPWCYAGLCFCRYVFFLLEVLLLQLFITDCSKLVLLLWLYWYLVRKNTHQLKTVIKIILGF